MATTDFYGNEIGDYFIIDASVADIVVGGSGAGEMANAKVLNAQINYQKPLNPVAVFGKDVVYAFGQPQGTFSFGNLAGNNKFRTKTSNCKGADLNVTFGTDSKCDIRLNGISFKTKRGVTLHGAVFNSYNIQGSAQDAFFTENSGGVFHYITLLGQGSGPQP